MYDVLIKGGRVVDGSGSPWFQADVAISGGKVVKIGRGLSGAAVTIDAAGKVVSPGFIDSHTHSDVALLTGPRAESKVYQGVTTEVIGNCGSSPAPMVGEARERVQKQLNGTGVGLDWVGMDEYLERLDRKGVAVNVVPLVGFGTVRQAVMGKDTDRPATLEERGKMRALVEESVAEGAFGMSTMVDFTSKPQGIAPTDEVIDAAKGLKPKEALYVTHIRDEFDLKIGYAASLEEAVQIGTAAGVPTHISHLHALGVPKRAPQYVALIDKFRDSGTDVTADCYPYAVSAAGIRGHRPFLPIVIPAWALEGGRAKTLERLADKVTRDKIAGEIRVNFIQRGAERHIVRLCPANPELEGLDMAEVAQRLGERPEQAALHMYEQGEVAWVFMNVDEEDMMTFMKPAWVMGGSDGTALPMVVRPGEEKPHPRCYGTFPRWIGTYARDKGLLPLYEVVRKLTSLPAQRFGLSGRGLLREGFWADVTVFDAASIRDTATFHNPNQIPVGIDCVLVNGQVVVQYGRHTGKLAGKALRHRQG